MLSIGRGESCDLCLPHRQVSRLHAVVKIRSRTIVIEDEGSANGTIHNGLPITSAELAVGDKVLIGPYELEIRHPDQLLSPNQSTTTIHNSRLLLSEAAFGGQLADFPISELLQQLEFNQKTGLLKISASDDHSEGMLVVRDGAPVMARFGEHEAEQAVLVMVTSLADGRFSFRKEEVPGSHRLNATLTGLLLEASRRIDENVPLVVDDIDVDDTEVRGIPVEEVRAAAEARRAELSAGGEAALEHSDELLEEKEPAESAARDEPESGGTSYPEDSTSEPKEGGMDSKAWDDFWGG